MEHCAMTADHRHVVPALLALLCAGVLGLIAAVLWVLCAHPFTILVFGRPRLTARQRKALLRIPRAFEALVARALAHHRTSHPHRRRPPPSAATAAPARDSA